jgi:hypothetical protein
MRQVVQARSAGLFRRPDGWRNWAIVYRRSCSGLLSSALCCYPFGFAKGGYAHPEGELYIPHYLSQLTLLQKVYDPSKVEIDHSYQPRVLSYATDDLDVAFIAWSTRHGHPHFLAASHFVFWGGDCLLLWFYLRRRLGMKRWMTGTLICLLSTDPALFTNVMYIRSAKAGATFFMLSAFIVLSECFRLRLRSSSKRSAAALAIVGGILLLCACLFDEIPAGFTLAAILALSLECYLSRGTRVARAAVFPLLTMSAVLLIYAWNDLVLHPRISLAVTGKPVTFDLQGGVLRELFRNPLKTLIGSVSVFTDAFGYLIGGVSGFLGLVAMILLISAWRAEGKGQFRGTRLAWLVNQKSVIRVLFAGALMLGCLYAMVARHPPIMWADVRRAYYILPLSMVFFLFIAITANRIVGKGYLDAPLLSLTILTLATSNVVLIATATAYTHTTDRPDIRSPLYTRILINELKRSPSSDVSLSSNPGIAEMQRQILQSPAYRALAAAKNAGRNTSK